MKIFILTLIICLNVIGLNAQRLTNSSRSTIGYIENGRVMGSNRSTLGYFDGERIMNSSRSTIGYFANGKVMNSSRSTIGYLENGRVTNSSRSTIGYWETGRIMNSSRSTLGYYEGVNDEQASLFFFFFFYGSVITQIPTLSTSAVSNLGTTTATSGGNVSADGGSTVTARGVVWSTNPTPVVSLTSKTSNGTGTGTFSSSLTSLSPNTTYYVRAYATNSAGTAYGNEISFKTNSSSTLSVTPSVITFGTIGGAQSVFIRSNAAWSISEGFDFISVYPTSGNGDASVTIQCNANNSQQSRSGSLLVNVSGLPVQMITLLQESSQVINTTAILRVDISKAGKAPKDLLGVNLGPGTSVKGYQEAGIREIRTHDFYGPFDYWNYTVNALDTTAKRFRSTFDPTKESSYNWKESDAKMDTIISNGFKAFFRLGISYPHHPAVPTFPPLDALAQSFMTFGEISRRTVMHYTKGWHNGFTYPIRYWEIWNEPDFKEKFWSGPQGTPINYFNLYKSASAAIKEVDAQLKVGGPGLAYASLFFKNQGYVTEFMAYCQTNRLPLDFYSWHLYDVRNPQGIKAYAETIRNYLDKYGYTTAESFITEINPDLKGASFQNNARGAAWVIGAFISCNQSPVDKFFWYRGVQLSPLTNPDGTTSGNLLWTGLAYKIYASFLLENVKTIPLTGELFVSSAFDRDTTSLQALAGQSISMDTISVLISHLNSPSNTLNVELANLPWNGSARMVLTRLNDPDRKLVITETNSMVENGKVSFSVPNASTPGTCLLRIIRKQTSTSIPAILPAELFEIFPNPSTDDVNLLPLSDLSGKVTLQLIGLNGQQIWSKQINDVIAGESIQVSLNRFQSGLYLLRIQTENGVLVRKLEIIR